MAGFLCWLLIAGSCAKSALAITAEMQGILDQHNIYRCMHAVPRFTWDDAIAANAQAWASNGVYEHSQNSARNIGGEQCGENLAWGYPSRSGTDSTIAWYEEITFTNAGTPSTPSETCKAGEAIGHYTQVVWKGSTKIGCGKGKATVRGNSGDYWVCQYCTAGNYVGNFAANVLAPTVSASSCGGSNVGSPGSGCSGGSGSNGASSGSGSNSASPTPAPNPSSCTPSPLLPNGGLCVYGYQCASKFCCPRLKACLADASTGISSSDLKVDPAHKDAIKSIVFGGTCDDPYTHGRKCMQTGEGQPLSTWDQTACDCHADYMTRYNDCTWVSLNTGVTCSCGAAAASNTNLASPAWRATTIGSAYSLLLGVAATQL